MIYYYTASQKTKVFAEALASIKNQPLYELKTTLNNKSKFKFMMHSLYLAVTGKAYPVSNMPGTVDAGEIFVCCPVWGGNIAAPAWFFLNNAQLTNIRVHLLLTCGSVTGAERYKKKSLDSLRLVDCIPGQAYVFATTGTLPEPDIVFEHIRAMIPVS